MARWKFNEEYYEDLSKVQNARCNSVIDIMTITGMMKSASEKIKHLIRYAERAQYFEISDKWLNRVTKKEKLVFFFSSMGFPMVKDGGKYTIFESARTSNYIYIGKSGALRVGKTASKSKSYTHTIDRVIDIERMYFHRMKGL